MNITEALKRATVLMPVIGPQWLHIHDEHGRRRIDSVDDWVLNEIMTAIKSGMKIVPVLVSGASLPTSKALPPELVPLLENQAYEIKDEYWERDTEALLNMLAAFGLERISDEPKIDKADYPPPVDCSKPLSAEELEVVLKRIPDWRLVRRPPAQEGAGQRIELHRTFRFRSFEDAMHFIHTASRYISMTSHHPDWQNIWISVRVWLTTWDIGHQPSFKDVRLAEYLDELYLNYTVS